MSTARPASPTTAAVIATTRLALGLAVVLLGACGQPRDTVAPSGAGGPQVSACVGCHGDPQRTGADPLASAAPPVSPSGSATGPGVGAHLAHLYGGALRGPVSCQECHLVPTSSLHANGVVEVAFTGADLAVRQGAAPRFEPATASCSTTYCHGATLAAGGSNQAPAWTGGAAQAACGTCHGIPPSTGRHATHSGKTTCGDCHPGYGAGVNLATHIDGTRQVGNKVTAWSAATRACTGCHGPDSW